MNAALVELFPSDRERIDLPDGSHAERAADGIDLKAPDGSLLLRFEAGKITIAPPRGDLELAAPAGRVVVRAALDVSVEAGRDVTQKAGRRMALEARELEASARTARLGAADATVVGRRIAATAETLTIRCARYELEATRIVEKAKEMFRDVEDLAQDRLGRARTIVRDVYSLATRRSVMTSEEDTAIDGSKILIG
jgi:hypothetical protein